MKKYFSMVAVAVAALFTACTSETEIAPEEQGMGTLSLVGTTVDAEVVTRANVTGDDLEDWLATISQAGVAVTGYEDVDASTISNVELSSGDYAVSVKNYADMATALAVKPYDVDDNAWGAAYYKGSEAVNLKAGEKKSVTVACGGAQNGRVSAEFDATFTGNTYVTEGYTLTVKNAESNPTRSLTFNASNTTKKAYFGQVDGNGDGVSTTVYYSLSYTYGETPKTITGSFTLAPATEKKLKVTMSTQGTISLIQITYDEFGEPIDEPIALDALTGEKQ